MHCILDTILSLLSLKIMSSVNGILRRQVFKFDRLADNLCAENMHLQGSIIQGSRYN